MRKLLIISYLYCLIGLFGAEAIPQLEEAETACRKAMELAAEEPAQAMSQWQHAASLYEAAIQDGTCYNGEIYYNLGNVYAQLGELPRAIASYRRAQGFLPHNRELQANLQYVRAQRQDHFAEPETSNVLATLFFWHYDLSFHTRIWLTILLSTLGWLAAFPLIWRRRGWLLALALLFFVGAAACGTSAGITYHATRHLRPAVIQTAEVILRKGDGASYSAAYDAPVHAATEVTILRQSRNGWCEIALPNRQTGWLEATDLIIL